LDVEVEADLYIYMGVSKNRGTPKMDGENNGKPYQNGMIWGETPRFSETSISFYLFLSGKLRHLSVVLLAQKFKEMQQKPLDIAHQ